MPDWRFLDDQADDATIRISTTHRNPPARKGSSAVWKMIQAVAAIAWLTVLGLLVGGCWRWAANRPQQAAVDFDQQDNRSLAVINAQSHIKTMLLSPRSAKWPGIFDGVITRDHAVRQRHGSYVVRSWVDADNAFGASIRTWFVVHLRVRPNGNAEILSAQLLE